MQKSKSSKTFSQSYNDTQQQIKKQLISQLFPSHFGKENICQEKIYQNLIEHYIPSQHKDYLLNYTFRNHHSQAAKIYKQFLNQKYPEIIEPMISHFYPNQSFPNLENLGQFRQNLLQYPKRHVPPLQQGTFVQLDNLFWQYGYIPHLERYLTFFPNFLIKVRMVEKELFQKSKIDQQSTYFIGLCAAAQVGCPYMINRMGIKYLSKGGKSQWIQNKKYSAKIGSILNLNRKLARCMWDLTSQDLQQIVEAGYWNINQLALIVQIISFTQSLCTITLGLGLIAQQKNYIVSTQKIQQYLKKYRQTQFESIQKSKKQSLLQILPNLKAVIEQIKNNGPIAITPKVNPKKSFRKQRKNSGDQQQNLSIQPYMKQIGIQLTQQKLVKQVLNQLSTFLPQFNPIQKRKDNKSNQFTCVDFNFQFMSFPRLQSLSFVSESTKKILSLIKQSQQMGLQNFGSQMISTTKQLRKAQRYYGENLCGFSHPEYDYKKFMTNILTMPLKFYIRLLMLSPLHINRQTIQEINHQKGQVELFDLGHTAILIAVAKFKLSLTLTTYLFDI